MTAFQPGDTVRFRIDEEGDWAPEKIGWYAGVLSTGSWPAGWLRIDGDDFTEHPEDYRPTGWLVVRDGEPYSHLIKDLTLVHRPEQEGTTMPTLSFPLREGDRVEYTINGDHRLSEPLRPSMIRGFEARLVDPDGGATFITTGDHGTLAPAIEACDLVERHGLPVEVHELEDYGVCIIYTTLQDIDGMHYMHTPDKGSGLKQNSAGLDRCGLPADHPLRESDIAWDWVTVPEMDEAGVDRSSWPTPLRLVDNITPENDVSATSRIAELEAALEAEREERKREMLDYKAQVKAMARQVGADHGWCVPGQNEVLRDLGIETRTKSRVSVALEFDMVAFTDTENPTRAFAQDSLVQQGSMGEVVAALRELIDLDSDWEDAAFDESSINFRVTGVEDED